MRAELLEALRALEREVEGLMLESYAHTLYAQGYENGQNDALELIRAKIREIERL